MYTHTHIYTCVDSEDLKNQECGMTKKSVKLEGGGGGQRLHNSTHITFSSFLSFSSSFFFLHLESFNSPPGPNPCYLYALNGQWASDNWTLSSLCSVVFSKASSQCCEVQPLDKYQPYCVRVLIFTDLATAHRPLC